MSLIQGSLALKQFLVLGPVPSRSDLLEGLSRDQFRPFLDGLEEERFGFCSHENLLDPPDENHLFYDNCVVIGLRIDTRKVPPALLQSHVNKRLKQLRQEKDLAFIGKEARVSLQDEVKAELLPKQSPVSKLIELAWEQKAGILRVASTSNKAHQILIGLFIKAFGCELQPLAPLLLAGRISPHIRVESLMGLDPLDLSTQEEH